MTDWIEIVTKSIKRVTRWKGKEHYRSVDVPIEVRYILRRSDILVVQRYLPDSKNLDGKDHTSTIIELKYPNYNHLKIEIKGDCYKELNDFLTTASSKDSPPVHQIEMEVRRH